MSLYSQYITERTNDRIIEGPHGFVSYRFLDDGKTVYIVDIFIIPEARKSLNASELANMVVAEAKTRGCTELLGTVVPSTKNSTASLRVLLGYKMELQSAGPDLIIFRKDI